MLGKYYTTEWHLYPSTQLFKSSMFVIYSPCASNSDSSTASHFDGATLKMGSFFFESSVASTIEEMMSY